MEEFFGQDQWIRSETGSESLNYRADIDGLRTIAILPVLLFHVGATWIPGGFTGVDVFFVISGYLITSIIAAEIECGTFSVATFYKRRALRILPALTTVIVATALGSYFLLYMDQFQALGKTIAYTALFAANVYFWSNSGYFDADAKESPLLHMWSLGVEEQFYIVLPLLMILAFRAGKRAGIAAILALSVASFAYSVRITNTDPTTNFYMITSRFWELGIGSLLALLTVPKVRNAYLGMFPPLIGLWGIAFGMFALNEDAPFPGLTALFPVLGTALLIAYAPGTAVGWILSTKPMVWIGKISFSLYLWHWPIIVLYKARFGDKLSGEDTAVIVVSSFIAAITTYLFIETPFRTKKARGSGSGRVLSGAGILLASVIAAGVAVNQFGAEIFYSEEDKKALLKAIDYTKTKKFRLSTRRNVCYLKKKPDNLFSTFNKDICLEMSTEKPNYLLIGDSHAGHLWPGLSEKYPEINVMQATISSCRPTRYDRRINKPCDDMLRFLETEFVPGSGLDGVILAGRWRESQLNEIRKFAETMNKHAAEVILIGAAPEYNDKLPRLLLDRRRPNDIKKAEEGLDPDRKLLDDKLKKLASAIGISFISPYDARCDQSGCTHVMQDGHPLIYDEHHLNYEGSLFVAERMRLQWTPGAQKQ